ncbi:MAG: hypothetical protein KAS32_03910 [Candidatus Peribacteraceae bacterium]|nr:hypothetical protein [Candidatus Peribacteraceae bacterium]
MNWEKIKNLSIETFLEAEGAETITVIKTGFENLYLVVHDDSLHFRTGECEVKTKEEIEKIYNITLQI